MKLGVSTFAFTWSIGFAEQVPAAPMNAFEFLQPLFRRAGPALPAGDGSGNTG